MREHIFTIGDTPVPFSQTYEEYKDEIEHFDLSHMETEDGFDDYYFLDNMTHTRVPYNEPEDKS